MTVTPAFVINGIEMREVPDPARRVALRDAVIEAARYLVLHGSYCTVAESGVYAGPGNHLRDALNMLDKAEGRM